MSTGHTWGVAIEACGAGFAVRFDGCSVTGWGGADFGGLVDDLFGAGAVLSDGGLVDSAWPLRAAAGRLAGVGGCALIVVVHPLEWRAVHRTLITEALAPLGASPRYVPRWAALVRGVPFLDHTAEGTEALVVYVGARVTDVWRVRRTEDGWQVADAASSDIGVIDVEHAVAAAASPALGPQVVRGVTEGRPVGLAGTDRAAALRALDAASNDLADAVGVLIGRRSADGRTAVVLAGPGAEVPAVRREVERRTSTAPVPGSAPPGWLALYGAARRWAPALAVRARAAKVGAIPVFMERGAE